MEVQGWGSKGRDEEAPWDGGDGLVERVLLQGALSAIRTSGDLVFGSGEAAGAARAHDPSGSDGLSGDRWDPGRSDRCELDGADRSPGSVLERRFDPERADPYRRGCAHRLGPSFRCARGGDQVSDPVVGGSMGLEAAAIEADEGGEWR